jgi:hypothetical protein
VAKRSAEIEKVLRSSLRARHKINRIPSSDCGTDGVMGWNTPLPPRPDTNTNAKITLIAISEEQIYGADEIEF